MPTYIVKGTRAITMLESVQETIPAKSEALARKEFMRIADELPWAMPPSERMRRKAGGVVRIESVTEREGSGGQVQDRLGGCGD